MRDGFVFYRSYANIYKRLNKQQKVAFMDMLLDYALDNIEVEDTGVISIIFEGIKPQLDANNRKYENGKKGGRPKADKPLDERIAEAREGMKKKPK